MEPLQMFPWQPVCERWRYYESGCVDTRRAAGGAPDAGAGAEKNEQGRNASNVAAA
jgi:hypothetical protein